MRQPEDTKQQKAILRQSRAARTVRRRFGAGTRITTGRMDGTVLRHIPGSNAQGGHLSVQWDSGQIGRVNPIGVRVIE